MIVSEMISTSAFFLLSSNSLKWAQFLFSFCKSCCQAINQQLRNLIKILQKNLWHCEDYGKKTYFNLDLIDITSRAQTLKMVVFFQVGPPEQCGVRKIQCNVNQTWPCERLQYAHVALELVIMMTINLLLYSLQFDRFICWMSSLVLYFCRTRNMIIDSR